MSYVTCMTYVSYMSSVDYMSYELCRSVLWDMWVMNVTGFFLLIAWND